MAGAVGFEPTNAGIKTRCLRPLGDAPSISQFGSGKASTAWSNGDFTAPAATQDRKCAGSLACTSNASACDWKRRKQPLPVPVRQAWPNCDSAVSAASTAGCRRRKTGSNALPSAIPETKSAIVAGAASRVNSGAWNNSPVGTPTPGSTIRNQAAGKVQRGQLLAHALGPGGSTADEDRHVSPQLQAQFREPVRCRDRSARGDSKRPEWLQRRTIRHRSHRRPGCAFQRRCRRQAGI